jgi:hypothetical protein
MNSAVMLPKNGISMKLATDGHNRYGIFSRDSWLLLLGRRRGGPDR